jgi:hypothetical protein
MDPDGEVIGKGVLGGFQPLRPKNLTFRNLSGTLALLFVSDDLPAFCRELIRALEKMGW